MRQEVERILREMEKAISGKREALESVLTAALAGGHILLDDVPGVGKTTLCLALSRAVGLSFRRVQFTPDVLPSDIVGFSIYDRETGNFIYRPGVVNHAQLLLGDEINRASSRTQSALLEAMEENQVTVDGNTYPLEEPFLVVATQNSVGAAGTQLLPYAQMDRFLARLSLGYPDYEAQMALLRDRRRENPLDRVERVADARAFLDMRTAAREVAIRDPALDYITRLCMASRESDQLEIGVSPRGALFLSRMARARAFVQGRDYATASDIQAVFHSVCDHRVILSARARERGLTAGSVLDGLLDSVENADQRI